MLKVKRLHGDAKIPIVAYPGQDLGYDVYALENEMIPPLEQRTLRTGIAIEFDPPSGARLETKSSLAKLYASIEGGIIDASYRGEILVMMYNRHKTATLKIAKGTKIAQLLKDPNLTEEVKEVSDLNDGARGSNGFGSSGAV